MDEVPRNAVLLEDGWNGVYVPNLFAKNYDLAEWNVRPDDINILLAGPDHEEYWDTWDEILSYAFCRKDGKVYRLWQDGDLWAYCPEDELDDE